MGKVVYLCGPISHTTWDEATDWRIDAKDYLNKFGIKCLDPLRGKEFLNEVVNGERTFQAVYDNNNEKYEGMEHPFITLKGIFNRDKYDVDNSDLLLVNLLGAEVPSIGSICEIAWGHLLGKYVLSVMEEDNVHRHGFITSCSSLVLTDIDEALSLVPVILGFWG